MKTAFSQRFLILTAFVGFTLTIAMRDVVFRLGFAQGMTFAKMAILTGVFGLISTVIVLGRTRKDYRVRDRKLFALRLTMNLVSGFLVLKAFQLLPPSFISITTKSALPALILVAPLIASLRSQYSIRERILAVIALAMITLFATLSLSAEVPILGIVILLISIFSTLAEFLMLARSVKSESPVFISAIPSLALLVVGLTFSYFEPLSAPLEIRHYLLGAFAGIMFFGAYFTSLVRYKVLPPGLAEYPSLLTYFLILPAEIWFLGGTFKLPVFANAVVVLIIMTALLRLHKRKN